MKKGFKTGKSRLILAIMMFAVVVIIGSLTYAYFQARVENPTTNKIIIKTVDYGELYVTYETGTDHITSDNVNLPYEERNTTQSSLVKFTVTNTGEADQGIMIGMKDVVNTFCKYANLEEQICTDDPSDTYVGNELVYNLYTCSAEDYVGATVENVVSNCDLISNADTPTPETSTYAHMLSDNYVVSANNTISYYVYILRLRNLDAAQNYNNGKTFDATTYVEVYENMLITWEGQLLDENGDPISFANLTLHSDPVTTTTDENGYYKFENIMPYDHTLVYEKDGETISSSIKILPSSVPSVSRTTINYNNNHFGVNALKIEDDIVFAQVPQVTLDITGGSLATRIIDVVGTEDIIIPINPYIGYTLDGADISCSEGIDCTIVDGNIVIDPSSGSGNCLVRLNGNSYTLFLAGLNGEVPQTKPIIYKNPYGELPDPTVMREGYNAFDGWFTLENGGNRITAESIVSTPGDITLYAHYKTQYQLTYDCTTNGGECVNNQVMLDQGTNIDLTKTATHPTSFFMGWNTNKDAKEGLENITMPEENLTLYAIYTTDAVIPTSEMNCEPNIIYDGSPHVITRNETGGYDLNNITKTEAGNYTVTAQLQQGYVWTDDTYGDKSFVCSISRATTTATVEVTGNNKVGQELTATVTTLSPGVLSYQWYTNTTNSTTGGTAIPTAVSNTYVVKAGDLGKYIYVVANIQQSINYNAINNTYDFADATNNGWDVVVENSAPTILIDTNQDGIYTKTKNIPISLSDSNGLRGSQNIKYGWSASNTSEPATFVSTSVSAAEGSITGTATATGTGLNGSYYLWVKTDPSICDIYSNCGSYTIISSGTYNFDNTAPVITDLQATKTNNAIDIEITATDVFTNMNNASYYVAYTTGSTCEGLAYTLVTTNEYSFTAMGENQYMVCAYAVDSAENRSEGYTSKNVSLYYATFGSEYFGYDDQNHLAYKMLKDTNVFKTTNAPTLTHAAGPATLTNVVAENGIFRTTDNDGYTYFYRGGEGCSSLGAELPAYTTYATCTAANGYWASVNDIDYSCYTNGTPNVCTANGGTWRYLNNNVSLGGFNWKIVRINGDGSIRLVLDGLTSTVKKSGLSEFAGSNALYNNSVDYNAGTPASANQDDAKSYASYTGGNLESAVNSFYTTFLNTNESLVDSSFCSNTDFGDTLTDNWFFTPAKNIWSTAFAPGVGTSTLTCPTANTYNVGGSSGVRLTNPIGVLSADEVIYAGGRGATYNSTYYLNNPETITGIYWTMSPFTWDKDGYVSAVAVTAGGRVGVDDVSDSNGVRVVINISADTVVTGIGTKLSPYVVTN